MGRTRQEYSAQPRVSSQLWRIAILSAAAVGAAMVLAVGLIVSRLDVRRQDPRWADEFDSRTSGWTFHSVGADIRAGTLQLRSPAPGEAALAIHALPAPDFVAETLARAAGGSLDNAYGLVVGDGAQTAFLVSSDGYFSIMEDAGAGWRAIQPWRPWPHVRRGDSANTLRVECLGGQCAFFINEEFTTQLELSPARATIGLLAQAFQPEPLAVEYAYLRVWDRR